MKGFVGQVGAHRRGHMIKPVGLLHNGTFTSPSPPDQKKIQFAGFCFSYIVSQCGDVDGLISLCVFCMNSSFEKDQNELKKIESTG